MPTAASISSVTIWDNFGFRLPAHQHVQSVDISIGSKESRSGCQILPAPPPPLPADGSPLPANFTHYSLICGAVGTRVAISLGSYIDKASAPKPASMSKILYFLHFIPITISLFGKIDVLYALQNNFGYDREFFLFAIIICIHTYA